MQVTARRVPPWTVLDAGELQLKLQVRLPARTDRLGRHPGGGYHFLFRSPVIQPTRGDRSLARRTVPVWSGSASTGSVPSDSMMSAETPGCRVLGDEYRGSPY